METHTRITTWKCQLFLGRHKHIVAQTFFQKTVRQRQKTDATLIFTVCIVLKEVDTFFQLRGRWCEYPTRVISYFFKDHCARAHQQTGAKYQPMHFGRCCIDCQWFYLCNDFYVELKDATDRQLPKVSGYAPDVQKQEWVSSSLVAGFKGRKATRRPPIFSRSHSIPDYSGEYT